MNFNILLKRFKRLISHYFWHDKLVFISFVFGITVNILFWVFLFLKLKTLEEIIPLHSNVYFGIDMIDSKYELLKMPILGMVIAIVNTFLAFKIYKHERINAYFLLIGNGLIQVFLLIAGVLIVNL